LPRIASDLTGGIPLARLQPINPTMRAHTNVPKADLNALAADMLGLRKK
jgi:hypothetical protein